MKAFAKTILLLAAVGPPGFIGGTFAQTNTPRVETFLPKGTVTDAVYVEIERDPAVDDYARRIRQARQKNPQWFFQYTKSNPPAGSKPVPYHENFGVSKEEYEHFSQPKNQYREVKRKDIKIRRNNQNGQVQLDFQGDDLLLTQVMLNLTNGTAKTALDVLPAMEFVDQEIATLPPDRHRGFYFRTTDAKITSTRQRESLMIGELKDKNSGIIHYAINTPRQVKMIYIQFSK